MDWFRGDSGADYSRSFVEMVMNVRVSYKTGNLLFIRCIISLVTAETACPRLGRVVFGVVGSVWEEFLIVKFE